jgi:hypothetical protein
MKICDRGAKYRSRDTSVLMPLRAFGSNGLTFMTICGVIIVAVVMLLRALWDLTNDCVCLLLWMFPSFVTGSLPNTYVQYEAITIPRRW